MTIKFINYLVCPYCSADLRIKKELILDDDELIWGIISCPECRSEYPIIEGIPVIMPSEKRLNVFAQTQKVGIEKSGIAIAEVCKYLKKGEIEEIRNSIIYSIPYESHLLPTEKDRLIARIVGKIGTRTVHKILRGSFFNRQRVKKLKEVLQNDNTTAYDAMRLYYQHHELLNYFFYKFGQPRFLTSLGLASVIDAPETPILDLACGQGHLMHFLTNKYNDRTVIGLDRNFFQLYLAKNYIAPGGHYVCAEADEKLPFRENMFNDIICTDAFHYLRNKANCIRDLKHILNSDGTIIINRIGNQYLTPNEGIELTPDGYVKLFNGMPLIMRGENKLLNEYLSKQKPDLSHSEEISDLNKEKWLTIVASNKKNIFKDHGVFEEWPHGIGVKALNPLYKEIETDKEGSVLYKFSFPSEWYNNENALWEKYAPNEISIPPDIIDSLKKAAWTPEMNEYIADYVILGYPERYM